MNKFAYVVIACIGLFVAGIVFYYTKEEPPKKIPESQPAAVQETNLTMAGTSITEDVDGRRHWELNSETITVDPATKLVRLNKIKGTVFQDKGGKIEIVAQNAVVDPQTHDVTMEGDIQAISSEGGKFTSAKAVYSTSKKQFDASGGVKVVKDDAVIIGDHMESDSNMEKIKISGKARVIKGGTAGEN